MMEHYTHDNWETWFEHLSSPFTHLICGEDLKYEEEFKYLKSSFSGVSELDCKNIFITGTQLTAEKSKDLRIVSYVLFASASEYGVEGLTYSFKLFNSLIEQFLADVHPLKDKARKAVHTWLLSQQSRIIALAEQQGQFEPQQIVLLQEQVALYGTQTVRQIDEDAGPLSDLMTWIEKLIQKYPVPVATKAAPAQPAKNDSAIESVVTEQAPVNQEITPVAATPIVAVSQSIDSDAQFSETLRKLLNFDKEQQNFSRMIALSRAARWADMQIPPNEQGKTRIPAPRNTAFAPIKNALANENYTEALLVSEALFMEGAMHFNLDLQAMQLSALKGLGKSTIVSQLELNIFQLISRFPQLANLTYDDGSALCSAKTKEIMTEITAQFSPSSQAGGNDNEAFEEAEQAAKQLVEQGKLDLALAELNQLSANTAYETSNVQLIKAKMCLQAERYDFAAPILQQLLEAIDKHQLNQWQPTFCMQVWRSAVLCFETLAANGNEAFAEQSNNLKQKMILTQPEVALGWI